MATVYLPLSSFSRKILLTEYGFEDPVTPGRADWLSDMLRIDRSDTRFADSVTQQLTSGLHLQVSAALADRIVHQGVAIGAVIHRHHIEQLTRHMLASSMGITNAKASMQAFYEYYGLDDDDVAQESVYREYNRFKRVFFRAKRATTAKKSAVPVRPNSQVWQGFSGIESRISNADLEALCRHLDERLAASRIRRVQRLSEWSRMYIYAVRGGRPPHAIARRFRKHLATVYRAQGYVRLRIRRDRRFAAAILPLLDDSFVLPGEGAGRHICTKTPAAAPAASYPEPQSATRL